MLNNDPYNSIRDKFEFICSHTVQKCIFCNERYLKTYGFHISTYNMVVVICQVNTYHAYIGQIIGLHYIYTIVINVDD